MGRISAAVRKFRAQRRKAGSPRQRRKQITGRVVTGLKTHERGRENLVYIFWTALGGAGAVGIDNVRSWIEHEPVKLRDSLLEAGIFAAGGAATAALVGTAQMAYGRLKAGRNLKRLKPLVWGKPTAAREVVRRLSKLNVERETLDRILLWGRGQG